MILQLDAFVILGLYCLVGCSEVVMEVKVLARRSRLSEDWRKPQIS